MSLSQRWADLVAVRFAGQPWEDDPENPDRIHPASVICICGRTESEHRTDLVLPIAVAGAQVCAGFDPAARIRQVTRWQIQTADPEQMGRP